MRMQAVRHVEQQLVLESLVKFMNIIDGLTTDQAALDATKTWSLQDLEAFFQVGPALEVPTASQRIVNCMRIVCTPSLDYQLQRASSKEM